MLACRVLIRRVYYCHNIFYAAYFDSVGKVVNLMSNKMCNLFPRKYAFGDGNLQQLYQKSSNIGQ